MNTTVLMIGANAMLLSSGIMCHAPALAGPLLAGGIVLMILCISVLVHKEYEEPESKPKDTTP